MTTEYLIQITISVCFGVGALFIGLASLRPGFRPRTPELWALYRSEFLIVGALLIPAAFGGAFFTAVLIAFVWRSQMEMLRLFDAPLWGPAQFVASITTIALVIAGALGNFRLMAFALGPGMILVALVSLGTNEKRAVERAIVGAGTLIYPGLLTGLIAALRAGPDGFAWLFLVYATVEIADTFALLFGKLIGRVHPFPRLSPKKTAEGVAAGFCVGGAAGVLLAHEIIGLSWLASIVTAAIILAMGLAGDLAVSALKRSRGKKDFMPLLRLHGGALDIYDSFLLAAPAAFLLRPVLAA